MTNTFTCGIFSSRRCFSICGPSKEVAELAPLAHIFLLQSIQRSFGQPLCYSRDVRQPLEHSLNDTGYVPKQLQPTAVWIIKSCRTHITNRSEACQADTSRKPSWCPRQSHQALRHILLASLPFLLKSSAGCFQDFACWDLCWNSKFQKPTTRVQQTSGAGDLAFGPQQYLQKPVFENSPCDRQSFKALTQVQLSGLSSG